MDRAASQVARRASRAAERTVLPRWLRAAGRAPRDDRAAYKRQPRDAPSAAEHPAPVPRTPACRQKLWTGSSEGFRRRTRAARAAILALLLELLADARALELRQVVDEQLAVEMIDLVLNAHGEQPVGVELDLLAVAVQGTHADLLRARHLVEVTRHRQATFLRLFDARAPE